MGEGSSVETGKGNYRFYKGAEDGRLRYAVVGWWDGGVPDDGWVSKGSGRFEILVWMAAGGGSW